MERKGQKLRLKGFRGCFGETAMEVCGPGLPGKDGENGVSGRDKRLRQGLVLKRMQTTRIWEW